MRDLLSKFIEFLHTRGIDPNIIVTVMGSIFLLDSVRQIRMWDKLKYWEKWLVLSQTIGSIAVILFCGILLLRGGS